MTPRNLPALRQVMTAPSRATATKLANSTFMASLFMVAAVARSSEADDGDDGDGDQGLHEGGREAQGEALAQGLLVGHEIGRDHALAVAGAGGMEDAIGEADEEQGDRRRAVLPSSRARPPAGCA